jgi:hypothetical protein
MALLELPETEDSATRLMRGMRRRPFELSGSSALAAKPTGLTIRN